jgi:hypothetical protein
MEIKEIIMAVIGAMVSIVAFYLKRESTKIEKLGNDLREIQIDLAKNNARDSERWIQTKKLLEDRREDVIKIFQELKDKK